MKKIFKYILGAIFSINTSISFATDKFEVLPDLPDPLAYAMQPVEASTISGSTDATSLISATQTVGTEPSLISVIFSLGIVILLIYITGIIYAKLNKVGTKTLRKQHGDFASSHVSVLSTTQLGNNKTLHVVELDGKRMLIGASSGAIQLIKDLGSFNNGTEEEFSHIEIPNIKIPKIEIPKIEIPTIGLSKLITKTHKTMESILEENEAQETSTKTEVESSTTINNSSDFNQDGIIDTLFSQPQELQQENSEVDTTVTEHIVDPDDFALYKKYLN